MQLLGVVFKIITLRAFAQIHVIVTPELFHIPRNIDAALFDVAGIEQAQERLREGFELILAPASKSSKVDEETARGGCCRIIIGDLNERCTALLPTPIPVILLG